MCLNPYIPRSVEIDVPAGVGVTKPISSIPLFIQIFQYCQNM